MLNSSRNLRWTSKSIWTIMFCVSFCSNQFCSAFWTVRCILSRLRICRSFGKINCNDFKNGTFLISQDSSFYNASKIIRNNTLQQQISPSGDTLHAQVEWLNDCSYILKFDKNKMALSPFQINLNTHGGILVEFGQPSGNIMPYTSVIKGKSKTEIHKGFLKIMR